MKDPLISVIVPVYNPGVYFYKCIESLINQTYKNLQIILIDDGSTDGSGDVCDNYAKRDDRIKCIHQSNRGVSKARNAGISVAVGDFFHFPDSDDYLDLDTYEVLISIFYKHHCDAVSFEYYVSGADSEIRHVLEDSHYGLFDTLNTHKRVMTGSSFAWNKLLKKELIIGSDNEQCITFREDIYRGEDTLFVQQALDRAKSVWFEKQAFYHYVQTQDSLVRGKFRPNQLSALYLYDAYRELYQGKYPSLYPKFLKGMSHLLISLYYDMWVDDTDYGKDMIRVYNMYKKHEKEVIQNNTLSVKEKLKFHLFSINPNMYCAVHDGKMKQIIRLKK